MHNPREMKGLRIGVWIAGLGVGLVLLVAAGLVPGGLFALQRLARDHAAARVEVAAAGAADGVRQIGEHVQASARTLAERPTLQRLVGGGSEAELTAYLEQFRASIGADGCAVRAGGRVLAAAPGAAWPELEQELASGVHYLGAAARGSPVLIACAPLPAPDVAVALVLRALDGEVQQALATQFGLPVRIASADASPEPAADEEAAWRARRVLGDPAQGVAVEAELPASAVQETLAPIERAFVLTTAAALLAAIAFGAVAARRIARPLRVLQTAAEGIAAGDLVTPVPAIGSGETGALAATMEGMRRRLQRVTADLHRQEEQARALLDGMVEGVFAVDAERRIESMNPQAASRLGVRIEDAVGRFCGDVLRPAPRDGKRPCEDACPIVHARSRGSSRAVEHLQLAAGVRTVIITSAPPSGGRQVQLLRDETDTEAARRSRDAVLANVSHELKTPVSAQMASIQLLQDALGADAPPAAVELVESLERSTLRLMRLIDNLLESVRIETGRATLRRVEVDVAALVRDAEAMTFPLFRQRDQELIVGPFDAVAPVLGDPTQLAQVLVNLLANANKFAPERTAIRIGGSSDAATSSIWIEDRGPGIADAERDAVFDHYYRTDPDGSEGMGLGLWIVKAIVERHGGTVRVEAPEGGGTRFTVTLPRAQPAAKVSSS
jgi:signal transduction histidine kinase